MKVAGEAFLHAEPERVYAALTDPAVLVRTIPGCESLEALGDDSYRVTVTAGVASIKGTYDGAVRLAEQQPPGSFVLRAKGSGAPGTVEASVRVQLVGDGERTRLTYDADAVVGGMVGGVGQRMLASAARKMAADFFASVDRVLTGTELAVRSGESAARTVEATPVIATGTVYRAPERATPAVAPLVVAALVGAAIALVGVGVGWRLRRLTGR